MSKVFYAVNRETGERWEPTKIGMGCFGDAKRSFLMMYVTGFLAEVVVNGYDVDITLLDRTVWKLVVKDNIDKYKVRGKNER